MRDEVGHQSQLGLLGGKGDIWATVHLICLRGKRFCSSAERAQFTYRSQFPFMGSVASTHIQPRAGKARGFSGFLGVSQGFGYSHSHNLLSIC
ncbi:hypothetical protein EYF80_005894 [Liparis tanakae]|uniref:Uncharacterized protein n=1 Tax=Liparis tanakae TaxID=230148 RepID=A0A4Z2J3F7_9TELE|nr:hypothetical protein EYF80_005894 [Liparis tanakae]